MEVSDDKPPKPPPLLYEKEIETTLRKKQPWNHDPRYLRPRTKAAAHQDR